MQKQELIDKTLSYFDEGYSCSQAILLAFGERYNIDSDLAKRIASGFGGGMGRLREKCGALTGGFMVLGLAYGNNNPKDMTTKLRAYTQVRKLNAAIAEKHGTTLCGELLKQHATPQDIEERKHHKLICRRVIADTANSLYEILNKEKNND